MKKVLFVMMALVTSVTITACNESSTLRNTETTSNQVTDDKQVDDSSNEDTEGKSEDSSESDKLEVDLKKKNSVEDIIEYTIKTIETTSKLEPSNVSSFYTYYEPDDGNTLLHIEMDVKNLSDKDIDIDDVMKVTFTIDGNKYSAQPVLEEEDDFAYTTSIKQLMTGRIHFFTNIPTDLATDEINLNIKINDKSYETTFDLEEVKPEKNYVKKGDKLSKKDLSEVTIKSIKFTDKVEPSNPSSYYTYYEVKDTSNTYLALKINVKNLKGDSLDADKVMNAKLIYNDKYTYDCFSTIEKDGTFTYTNITSIDPLKKSVIYYLFEVPKEVKDGDVELQINYAGDKYFVKVK